MGAENSEMFELSFFEKQFAGFVWAEIIERFAETSGKQDFSCVATSGGCDFV